MKIGILTIPPRINYGGILQAYALQTVLEGLGHEVYVMERDTKEPLGETMKRIASSYVYHYNHKYQHLFFAHE